MGSSPKRYVIALKQFSQVTPEVKIRYDVIVRMSAKPQMS